MQVVNRQPTYRNSCCARDPSGKAPPTPPAQEIEAAVAYAESHGWRVSLSGWHAWSKPQCFSLPGNLLELSKATAQLNFELEQARLIHIQELA